MGSAPWAILDFPGVDRRPVRQVFRDPVVVLRADRLAEVPAHLREAERLAQAGHQVVGFVAYDAAPAFEPKFEVRPGYGGPLAWFGVFVDSQPWRNEGESPPFASLGMTPEGWKTGIDPTTYRQAVSAIIAGIERGDFYQVNYTDRFTATVRDPLAVYERVRFAQQGPYAAYIDTGDLVVASVSPELFVRRTGNALESHPMKGTSPRGRWPAEDDALARRLAGSEKERAENVMIVDLIRNDMGRVAVPGTVEVPSMFTIERYPTVLQMTSHVKSQVPATTSLEDVFRALFPCGSVTGAPKIAASGSIRTHEASPRGIYCGAVGVVRPGGDFEFNVAIRTIVVERDGSATYGAGGGITADSDPDRELDELRTKAAVLTTRPRTFGLVETLRIEDGLPVRLERHLARLTSSAGYFGFNQDRIPVLRTRLHEEARARPRGTFRTRILLDRDGSFEVSVGANEPLTEPRLITVSQHPVDSRDPLLYHKTSDRSRYSDRLAAASGMDDVILVNERGELTETTIGNVVVELDGRLLTPRLDSGLLPGILREELLDEARIAEAVLYPRDLQRCTGLWMINSLRGWVACRLA